MRSNINERINSLLGNNPDELGLLSIPWHIREMEMPAGNDILLINYRVFVVTSKYHIGIALWRTKLLVASSRT